MLKRIWNWIRRRERFPVSVIKLDGKPAAAFLSLPYKLSSNQMECLCKEWTELWKGTAMEPVKLVVLPINGSLQIGTVPAQSGHEPVMES